MSTSEPAAAPNETSTTETDGVMPPTPHSNRSPPGAGDSANSRPTTDYYPDVSVQGTLAPAETPNDLEVLPLEVLDPGPPDADIEDANRDVVDDDERDSADEEGVGPSRAKTNVERLAVQGGKAGNKEKFLGAPKERLEGYLDEFRRIIKLGRGKNKELGKFWEKVKIDIWATYTWEEMRESMNKYAVGLNKEDTVDLVNKVSRTPNSVD